MPRTCRSPKTDSARIPYPAPRRKSKVGLIPPAPLAVSCTASYLIGRSRVFCEFRSEGRTHALQQGLHLDALTRLQLQTEFGRIASTLLEAVLDDRDQKDSLLPREENLLGLLNLCLLTFFTQTNELFRSLIND